MMRTQRSQRSMALCIDISEFLTNFQEAIEPVVTISSPAKVVQALAKSFSQAIKKEEIKGKIKDKFVSFLDLLEKEASISGGRKPILIIREVQKLVDKDSAAQDSIKAFDSLFSCFEQHKEGRKNVSVIIESSEYLWSDLRRYVQSYPESFKEHQVRQWSKKEGFQELVTRHQIFTAKEYEKVWKCVGGHAGQIFDLHCDLRSGNTLREAIDLKNQATRNMLISILEGPVGQDYDDELLLCGN
jgi:hypothetical protein